MLMVTLMVLNSNFNHNFDVVFDIWIPIGLNALEFNTTVDGTEYAIYRYHLDILLIR